MHETMSMTVAKQGPTGNSDQPNYVARHLLSVWMTLALVACTTMFMWYVMVWSVKLKAMMIIYMDDIHTRSIHLVSAVAYLLSA